MIYILYDLLIWTCCDHPMICEYSTLYNVHVIAYAYNSSSGKRKLKTYRSKTNKDTYLTSFSQWDSDRTWWIELDRDLTYCVPFIWSKSMQFIWFMFLSMRSIFSMVLSTVFFMALSMFLSLDLSKFLSLELSILWSLDMFSLDLSMSSMG